MSKEEKLEKISDKTGQKILKSPSLLKKFTQIYNCLCRECQKKVLTNPSMDLDNYCDVCRPKVETKMQKIMEKFN